MKYNFLSLVFVFLYAPIHASHNTSHTTDKSRLQTLNNVDNFFAKAMESRNTYHSNRMVDTFDFDCNTDFFTIKEGGLIQQWSLIII